ncbi:hypothetical protein PIB30_003492 [Stylosanthes scabra]|uniref:Uncharacterized protein n=1 Tax=Stylosanthes scabra TaxID=79078 RepID=A0ABU6V1R1_9FABA|nr:hypothetical protein [Stylosanthes scabra]
MVVSLLPLGHWKTSHLLHHRLGHGTHGSFPSGPCGRGKKGSDDVVATLATNENPELCNDVLKELPFTVVQDHAVVSGESMYAWAPVISTAPVHVKERHTDAPVGRIRYSQATGNKIIVQYGEMTEDIETPVLGEIMPQYLDKLLEVGRAVWKSTFHTKEIILLTIETMD